MMARSSRCCRASSLVAGSCPQAGQARVARAVAAGSLRRAWIGCGSVASGPGGCGRRDGLAGLTVATGWFEAPVDGFVGHAEGFGDLGDGVLAFTVVAFLVVHAAGHRGLPGRQLGLAAADPAAGPGGFQAFAGAFGDEVGEHLVHRGEHVEGEPPSRGGGVDALLEHDQVEPAVGQERGGLGEVAHRAGHPGQPGDRELVPAAEMIEAVVPLGPPGEPAGGGVGPDALAAGGAQRVELGVVPLRASGDPGVPVPGQTGKCPADDTRSASSDTLFPPAVVTASSCSSLRPRGNRPNRP
jgi:hypothetical protein